MTWQRILPKVDAAVLGRVVRRPLPHESHDRRFAYALRRRPGAGVHLVTAVALLLALLPLCPASIAADNDPRKPRNGNDPDRRARSSERSGPSTGVFLTDVPAHPFDLILGRPTRDSITLSVLTYADLEGCVSWQSDDDATASSGRTPPRLFKQGEPVELLLQPLAPDTRYRYHFHTRAPGADAARPFDAGPEHTFRTARAPGDTFVFTITADSHLDENTTPAVYERTLANILADAPDFHVDLGDTFMTEKRADHRSAVPQYFAQRYYFGRFAHSAPLFLVLGNHDGESGRGHDGPGEGVAVWSNLTRKRYFPNPEPDAFYTGNTRPEPGAGLLQDYYAWEWGDALFVVLDPFWFTRARGGDDNWNRTLGRAQYDWLARTLERSHARFKFVFIHHLVGGLDRQGRGGVEAAPLYEWGGHDANGRELFREKRPDWPMPIHDLLVRNNVTAVFHGHDHLFAEQQLDGILYQEVPQPGHRRGSSANAARYGYREGVILDGSGHLRVTVSPDRVRIDFVSAAGIGGTSDRGVSHSRTID
jgi:hypothetical protein